MPTPEDKTDGEKKPSGRVRHDAGGRAIWEWAVESGRHAIDSTSLLLKKLNIADLSLLGDDETPPGKGSDAATPDDTARPSPGNTPVKPGRVESFDPYNNRSPRRGVSAAPVPKAPAKPRITQPPKRVKPAGFLARLLGRK